MVAQYDITSTAWTAITTAGQSVIAWLDEDGDGAGGRVDVRIVAATTTPTDAPTIAKRLYTPNSNEGTLQLTAETQSTVFYARCRNTGDTAKVSVATGGTLARILQESYSKDAVLTTSYADDYITRGNGFQVKKRIALSGSQTLYLEFDITKAVGKFVYALAPIMASSGGLVFVDTYLADSSTGGTTLVTPLNMNSLSSNAALTTVKTGVTVSGTPSVVREYLVGTTATNQSSGSGASAAGVPRILNNTKPLYFKIANQEASALTFNLEFVWYEI